MERFEFDLTKHKLKEIILQIQKGKAEFIERKSNRLTVFRLNYESKIMDVLYDKKRKTIVTFLTPKNL